MKFNQPSDDYSGEQKRREEWKGIPDKLRDDAIGLIQRGVVTREHLYRLNINKDDRSKSTFIDMYPFCVGLRKDDDVDAVRHAVLAEVKAQQCIKEYTDLPVSPDEFAARLARFKSQYCFLPSSLKRMISWREIENRLLANDASKLLSVERPSVGSAVLFGVDDNRRALFALDRKSIEGHDGNYFWNRRSAMHYWSLENNYKKRRSGWELFSADQRLMDMYENATDHSFACDSRDGSQQGVTMWFESGAFPLLGANCAFYNSEYSRPRFFRQSPFNTNRFGDSGYRSMLRV
ncbi:MAG: hypothetical protein US89_C0013G0007 [Candidatus Peregrinibacteria bacterium GW2011_GWF2_38_29]|nr:MAG: hypothetical protein US89_C0013G0007 [Candidatus Peregrinibacteria bacterium GW2011_GWF2_38_29]HBB02388.1 hypothetical protein [Candidatus Peregrinibacteria bacterium]